MYVHFIQKYLLFYMFVCFHVHMYTFNLSLRCRLKERRPPTAEQSSPENQKDAKGTRAQERIPTHMVGPEKKSWLPKEIVLFFSCGWTNPKLFILPNTWILQTSQRFFDTEHFDSASRCENLPVSGSSTSHTSDVKC